MAALRMGPEVISIQGLGPEGDVIKKPCEHKPLGVLTLVTESIQDSVVITLLRNCRRYALCMTS